MTIISSGLIIWLRRLAMPLVIVLLCFLFFYLNLQIRLLGIVIFFLVPSLLIFILDKNQDRLLSITTGLGNLTGILYKTLDLKILSSYVSDKVILTSLPDLPSLISIYSFSLLGYLIGLWGPKLFQAYQMQAIESKRAKVLSELTDYRKKWDLQD